MKELNNKTGISLIVLVITIIVMIILAAAIIVSLQSSEIIGRANEAKTQSDVANKKQAATVALAEYELKKQMGEIPAGTTATKYVKDRLEAQGIDANNVAVDENSKIVVGSGGSAIQKGVAVGDYVGYTIPTAVTSTKYKTFDEDNWKVSDTYFVTEINMKWKYMGVDEKGNALLVAEKATTDNFCLEGAEDYLLGPGKLDDLCRELYSTSLGEARSIDVKDVNMVLEANPVGQYYSKLEDKYVDNPNRLTIGEILSQTEEPALTGTETPDGEDINEYVADYYGYAGIDYKLLNTPEHDLIFKKVVIGEDGTVTKSNISYWLASSCTDVRFDGGDVGTGSYVFFGVRCVTNGVRVGYYYLSYSGDNGGLGPVYLGVRPVVSLNSSVQFGTKTDGVWSIE